MHTHSSTIGATLAVVLVAGLTGCASPATDPGSTATAPESTTDSTAAPAPADRIAFARFATLADEPMLWTANIDGSDQRPVGEQPGTFPDWSPDRTHLIFDYLQDGQYHIGRVNPDGTGFVQLTDDVLSEAPDYSPDGRTIVFDRSPVADENDPAFTTTLWTMAADGSEARTLLDPAAAGYDYEAEYSPDGSSVSFVRYDPEADASAVFVATTDDDDVRQASPFGTYVEHPRWSPDGATIIYNIEYQADLDDPRNGIWTVPAAGGEPTLLLRSTPELHAYKPDYSPDGTRILFGCWDRPANVEDLCVMNADGSEMKRIIRTAKYENHPVWD